MGVPEWAGTLRMTFDKDSTFNSTGLKRRFAGHQPNLRAVCAKSQNRSEIRDIVDPSLDLWPESGYTAYNPCAWMELRIVPIEAVRSQ